jgi:hypothetical protein
MRTQAAARGWNLGSLTATLLGPLDHHVAPFPATELQELILKTFLLPGQRRLSLPYRC